MRLFVVFVVCLLTVPVNAAPKKPARQPILWYRDLSSGSPSYLCLLKKGDYVRSREVDLGKDEKGRKTAYYLEGSGHLDEGELWVTVDLLHLHGAFHRGDRRAPYGAERLLLIEATTGKEYFYQRAAPPNLKGYRWKLIDTAADREALWK